MELTAKRAEADAVTDFPMSVISSNTRSPRPAPLPIHVDADAPNISSTVARVAALPMRVNRQSSSAKDLAGFWKSWNRARQAAPCAATNVGPVRVAARCGTRVGSFRRPSMASRVATVMEAA